MTRLDESVDHRVNHFGVGRSSPNSFDAFFKIVTSFSNCRIRFFAFASSILSGVVISGRSPRSIWSCRTQLQIAAALTPSSTAAVVIGFPARTSATALLRNSTGKGVLVWVKPLKESPIHTPFRVTKPWDTSSQLNSGQSPSFSAGLEVLTAAVPLIACGIDRFVAAFCGCSLRAGILTLGLSRHRRRRARRFRIAEFPVHWVASERHLGTVTIRVSRFACGGSLWTCGDLWQLGWQIRRR